MAIIAVLASLLIPALSRGKARALSIACLNNLRQMNIAWTLYSDENEDILAPNVREGTVGPDTPHERWVGGWMFYETHNSPPQWFPESTNTTLLIEPGPGRIGPLLKTPATFKCPGDRSYIILGGQKHSRVRSYSMNYFMGLHEDLLEEGIGGKRYTRRS